MLKSISCEAIIKTPITFGRGLNSIVGADDAHNSIGKSSILMLIDFAFGGNDFPNKCDDVIRNVGNFKVGIEFDFGDKFSFIRDTKEPDVVYFVEQQQYRSIGDFTSFLKSKYFGSDADASFRECVSGFFRIYQRNNYDDKRPLEIAKKENWESIRKRLLKMYDKYWIIQDLEKIKSELSIKSSNIKGTFGSGAVKKITKSQFKINEKNIAEISSEIDSIKYTLKNNVTDISSLINSVNLSLKIEKDTLVDRRNQLISQLARIESNLDGSKIRNSKSFQVVTKFFPNIDTERLEAVEVFHNGITRILKEQLEIEKNIILENINIVDSEIMEIDRKLLRIVDSKEDSVYLLERLMELDRTSRDLINQNDYFSKGSVLKSDLDAVKNEIIQSVNTAIIEIEKSLNSGMKQYIEYIYHDKAIVPSLNFGNTDYKFNHGDDRGTGKGYANMIALDLTFLEKTYLPCVIHDSLLFKNLDNPAIERLIEIYSGFDKQIFISIDEVSKYSPHVRELIKVSEVLKLDKDRVAFKIKWKNRVE